MKSLRSKLHQNTVSGKKPVGGWLRAGVVRPDPLFGQFLARFWQNLEEFGTFWWILRRVGEHFLGLLEDLTSCGGALFGTFGGFNVVWGSTFWDFWRI